MNDFKVGTRVFFSEEECDILGTVTSCQKKTMYVCGEDGLQEEEYTEFLSNSQGIPIEVEVKSYTVKWDDGVVREYLYYELEQA